MKTIKFYKEKGNWYSTIDGHTQAENRMILGADEFLEKVDSLTDKNGGVTVVCDSKKTDDARLVLKRIWHGIFGAYYLVQAKPFQDAYLDGSVVYLCNVVHTVFGRHPKRIYINSMK